MCIEAAYNNGLAFFNGLLEITNANINLCLSKQPTKVRMEVSGEMSVGSTDFSVQLFLDDSENYVIQASANGIPISDALSQFQANVLPPELNLLFSNIPFVHFYLRNPRLTYHLSSVLQQIQISGTPVVAGYRIVSADVRIVTGIKHNSIIEGFEIRKVNLADLFQKISGFNFDNIGLLNQDLEAAILISPVTLPNVHLNGEKLRHFSIIKGVSLQAEMKLPDDCSTDAFCAVAQFLLGEDARIIIRGTVESANRFSLFAGVPDISVGRGLTISSAGLEVEAGAPTTAGITGSILLSNPPIMLTSRVFLSTSGVVLSMSQGGCWDRAFGADWLSICNILGSVGLVPGIFISTVEIGGEVRLGDPTCFTPITATGFLGIDAVTPTNNYYYVEFTGTTTMESLLDAFCVDIDLPRPLGESGFPHGFLSSFSLLGYKLSHSDIFIPAGHCLKGTLNILGLESSADVTINLPDGFNFHVALPPINIGNGLLKMTVSQSDTLRGPYIRANIALLPSPKVDISASGFVEVLGISQCASLRITNSKYELSISGRMLNLFQADLMLSAAYGDLSQTSFRVKGSFRNDLGNKIEQKIMQVFQDSATKATQAINTARNKVNEQQSKFDSVVRSLQSAKTAVKNANSNFNSAEKKLKDAQDYVNGLCTIKSCSQGISIPSYTHYIISNYFLLLF